MIDLNLVRVFVTIFETGSVSGAAHRLNVTQPSISYSLSRMRVLLDDPLFKRSQRGMTPTLLSTQLYQRLKYSLSEIEHTIAQTGKFDPTQSTRKFNLALSDLGEIFFLPHILNALQLQAPHTSLEVTQLDITKLGHWLKTGAIDAAISNRSLVPVDANSDLVFSERYVCLISTHHPRVKESISLDQYLSEHHVVVSAATGHHSVEDRLRENGLTRKVRLHAPHFSALPEVISSSDLLATLPERIALMFSLRSDTRIVELPLSVPPIEVVLQWNDHPDDILAQRWFCQLLRQTLTRL